MGGGRFAAAAAAAAARGHSLGIAPPTSRSASLSGSAHIVGMFAELLAFLDPLYRLLTARGHSLRCLRILAGGATGRGAGSVAPAAPKRRQHSRAAITNSKENKSAGRPAGRREPGHGESRDATAGRHFAARPGPARTGRPVVACRSRLASRLTRAGVEPGLPEAPAMVDSPARRPAGAAGRVPPPHRLPGRRATTRRCVGEGAETPRRRATASSDGGEVTAAK
jgi:hypothetical protein